MIPILFEWSSYFLLVSLGIAVLTGVRMVARRGAPTALVGLCIATISASVAVLLLGRLFNIAYTRDIVLCLFIFGGIGMIMFSRYLRTGTFK